MRRANLALPALVLVVSGLLATFLVVAIGARDDLHDARRRADAAWKGLRPTLTARYSALAAAGDAVEDRLGATRPLTKDIDAALAGWRRANGVESQVRSANRLEGLAARLAATAAATPRLRASAAVQGALAKVGEGLPAAERDAFNREVAAYERSRGGFPRRLVAGALGFDSRLTFESPV